MRKIYSNKIITFIFTILLFVPLISPSPIYAEPLYRPFVWIDVPIHDLRISKGQEVRIEGHATYHQNLAQIDIKINNNIELTDNELQLSGKLFHFEQFWTPPEVGQYDIEVKAIGEDGSESLSDYVTIHVIDEEPEQIQESDLAFSFWADDYEVSAGSCTNVYWNALDATSVLYNGNSVAKSGSTSTCPCNTEKHTLIVTFEDGQQQKSLTIYTTGSCTPGEPPVDTTPPPIPTIIEPKNDVILSCAASAKLDWNDVSDPSGIDKYIVVVEEFDGVSTWDEISGSPFNVQNKSDLDITIMCGIYYRWKVKALDNAGNGSNYSGWTNFSVTLI
jgi:hypothetical protein